MASLRSAVVRPVLSAMTGPSSKVKAILWLVAADANRSVDSVMHVNARPRKRVIVVGMAECYAARARRANAERREGPGQLAKEGGAHGRYVNPNAVLRRHFCHAVRLRACKCAAMKDEPK